MFSEKNDHSKSCFAHWNFGVLILVVLIAGAIGCSSRETESDKLYSSEEASPKSGTDSMTSLPQTESSNQATSTDEPGGSSSFDTAALISKTYSPADRAIVLKYVEKGESDPENLSQALRLVQRAEQLSPSERVIEDFLILAAHYRIKGDMNQVIQYANQGIMAKSDSNRVKANMFIYLGYTYENKSQTMALSYFKQAAKIDPDFYKGHYELGRISYLKKKFSEAKAQLKKAFDLNPDNAEVYSMLGQMFYGMDQYEKAAESLEKALALSPQTHWILVKLGDTYFFGLKEREKGGQFYQQAVSKSGSDPEAHFGLALYYRSKSDYSNAEAQLQKAIALDYTIAKFKRELDDIGSEKIEMAEKIEGLYKAIAENPDDPSYLAQLGRFYLRWQKYDQAEAQFIKAFELASRLTVTPKVVKDSEDSEDSEDSDEPVVEAFSEVPEYASILGWFYFNDKKYDKAEKAFQSALKVDPKYTRAMFGLGWAYENLKQYKLAASQYAQTVASDPQHHEARDRLAALKKSGQLLPVGEVDKKPGVAPDKQTVEQVKK